MTLLFRSKSCRLGGESTSSPPSSSVWDDSDGNETEEEKTEEFEDNEEEFEDYDPISTTFINTPVKLSDKNRKENNGQFPILAFVATALRKSLLVTCSVEREDVSSLDISYPTNVQHISHVTFDRFKGFLGLPQEFQPEILKRVPSARLDFLLLLFFYFCFHILVSFYIKILNLLSDFNHQLKLVSELIYRDKFPRSKGNDRTLLLSTIRLTHDFRILFLVLVS